MKKAIVLLVCLGIYCGSDVGSVEENGTYFTITKRGDTTFAYLTLEKHSELSYTVNLHVEGDSVEWTTDYLDSNDNLIETTGYSTTDWSNYSYSLDANGYHVIDITLREAKYWWDPAYYGKYRGVCAIERLGGGRRVDVEFKGIR